MTPPERQAGQLRAILAPQIALEIVHPAVSLMVGLGHCVKFAPVCRASDNERRGFAVKNRPTPKAQGGWSLDDPARRAEPINDELLVRFGTGGKEAHVLLRERI